MSSDPLPQAWVPRVVNVALAAMFLVFLVPLLSHFGSRSTSVEVILGIVAVPVLLVTGLCLMSAVRPGSVGRLARRLRR